MGQEEKNILATTTKKGTVMVWSNNFSTKKESFRTGVKFVLFALTVPALFENKDKAQSYATKEPGDKPNLDSAAEPLMNQ